jgi:transposase
MNRFVQCEERTQDTFLPSRLEDYVTDDNPVRVIDVFVAELDLTKLGFEGMNPQATGRPGYHPSTLLKIYLYGYLNRIQSSRRLERETQRNVELMWLTGRLMPDFKTIANFRKDNGPAIRGVCRQFIVLCRQLNLFTQAVVAVDGSKFKAVNNRDRNFTSAKVQRRMEQIEASINRYMAALDIADQQEAETAQSKSTKLKEKIAALKKRMQHLKEIEVLVQATADKQISLTDPDARSMATSGKGTGVVGYNVQTVVDAQHHLIVAHEVTNVGNDQGQLATMAQQAQSAIGRKDLEVVADRGYFKGQEILACPNAGMMPFVPKPQTSGSKAEGRFGKQDFVYVAEHDTYRCPAGERLTSRFASVEDGNDLACLLDHGLPGLPAQSQVHDQHPAAYQAVGT